MRLLGALNPVRFAFERCRLAAHLRRAKCVIADEMQTADLRVRLHRYEPAKPNAYYTGLKVGSCGKILLRNPLSRRDVDLLEKIGANTTLWDGSVGWDGIPHPDTSASLLPPVPPAESDVSLVRASLEAYRNEARKARAIDASATAATNATLVLATPATGRGAANEEEVDAATNPSCASLHDEARARVVARTSAKSMAVRFDNFIRPALLARAYGHTHPEASRARATMAPRAARMHAAARLWALATLRPYVDACEAVHVLYAVEVALAGASRAIQDHPGIFPRLSAVENALKAAISDPFVPAALVALQRKCITWSTAVTDLAALTKKRKPKDLPQKLSYTYKLVGELYDAVGAWKALLRPAATQAAHKEEVAKIEVLNLWELQLTR